jgi:hypothetical protein
MRRSLRALTLVAAGAIAIAALVAPQRENRGRAAVIGSGRALDGGVPRAFSARPIRLVLSLDGTAGTRRIPHSFLGLSTEYWTLPVYERHPELFRRMLSLLHVRGDGPLILRIGGDSANHTRWLPGRSTHLPPWVLRESPGTLTRLAHLVRGSGVRLILDLNVATGSAQGALALARAADATLTARRIFGFEIGNEPDIVDRSFFVGALANRDPLVDLGEPLAIDSYVRAFARYARLLREVGPRPALIGLALANPARHREWISALLAVKHPGLRAVSAHFYPFSECAPTDSPSYPTIIRILNETTPPEWTRRIAAAARAARRAHLAFRLTELNSVACGGVSGVSNTFATALWAPDALFGLLRAGVNSVNVHVRAYPVNAAFAIWGRRVEPRPLLYGLILFARTLGPGAMIVPLRIDAQPGENVTAWAVRIRPNLLHVLVLDKDPRALDLRLRVPPAGRATVQRLLAPAVTATHGVTFAGRHLTPSGQWRGKHATSTIRRVGCCYRLTLPPMSAALVSLRLKL